MGISTSIEWCDATLNAWIGCSVGCSYCYTAKMAKRLFPESSFGKDAKYFPAKSFRQKALALNKKAERLGVRYRVFGNSMNDWLDPHVPIELLIELLEVICITPNLEWLLLTKIPENWKSRIQTAGRFCIGKDNLRLINYMLSQWLKDSLCLRNVWIGATVTNQNDADYRIPNLLDIPAKVRFLSVEPMLGAIDLETEYFKLINPKGTYPFPYLESKYRTKVISLLNWVICGGETGNNARPMHPDWVRSLRDQCVNAGVSFFFKGWGEYYTTKYNTLTNQFIFQEFDSYERWVNKARSWLGEGDVCLDKNGNNLTRGSDFMRARDEGLFPVTIMSKVGKKKSGRLLDGREWNQITD